MCIFEKKNFYALIYLSERIKDYVIGGDVNIDFLKRDCCTLTI